LGTDTARNLLEQREKLERTEKNLDDINYTTQQTQRSLNSLKSVFGGFFKNKFSRTPQKPQSEIPQSVSTNKLSKTLEDVDMSMSNSKSMNSMRSLSAESRKQIQGTRWGAMDEEIDENLGMQYRK
jgi:synaptosomal-associated protein 29